MLDEKTGTTGVEVRERTDEAAADEGVSPTLDTPRMSEKARFRLFLVLLLGPTVLVVLAVLAYPFLYKVVLSLSNMNI